jgi:hypothetical protein
MRHKRKSNLVGFGPTLNKPTIKTQRSLKRASVSLVAGIIGMYHCIWFSIVSKRIIQLPGLQWLTPVILATQ